MRGPRPQDFVGSTDPVAAPTVPSIAAESLSAQLRTRTAALHRRVEHLLELPEAIGDRRDYADWLGRFWGFYEPLEGALAAVVQPDEPDVLVGVTRHSHRLVDDLRALEVDRANLPRVLSSELPRYPTFAHVVGAHYVLMGATLGGRYILRDLDARLGDRLGAATRFFSGDRSGADPSWPVHRAAIDRFGVRNPSVCIDVVSGAMKTFEGLHRWFVPFCDARDRGR